MQQGCHCSSHLVVVGLIVRVIGVRAVAMPSTSLGNQGRLKASAVGDGFRGAYSNFAAIRRISYCPMFNLLQTAATVGAVS